MQTTAGMPYKDPNRQAEYFAEYRSNRRLHYVELSARWRRKNPKRWEETQRNYRENNRESINQKARDRYARDPKHVLLINTRSIKKNPHLAVSKTARRRARMSGPEQPAVAAFIKSVRRKKRVICYWCKSELSGNNAHIDHILALALGGRHTIENICVSCADCNLKKHAKPVSALNIEGQQFLSL